MAKNTEIRVLPALSAKQASEQALEVVDKERSGEQLGVYCQYKTLNIAMGKYWRFNTVNLIAGLSGHGKSYLLNLLSKSFINFSVVNPDLPFIPIILQFCFEMSAYNEVLRSIANDLGVSYEHLLSSSYNKETDSYNSISDAEYTKIKESLEYYGKSNILFFEVSGNVLEILQTVRYYRQRYTVNAKTGKPYKLIVNIDHTLLIDKLNEEQTIQLMADVGKIAIIIRKECGAMVNLLGQLNNNIEDVRRLTNPALHYPQKSDIYAQGQLFNACDNVFVINQPQLLKLPFYGTQQIPTKDLIHFIKLKSRHGKLGSIWFKNNLNQGGLDCININDYLQSLQNRPLNQQNSDYNEEQGEEDYNDVHI